MEEQEAGGILLSVCVEWGAAFQTEWICSHDWGRRSSLQTKLCSRDFSPWQTPVKSHCRATGLVLGSPSLLGGMRSAGGLSPSFGPQAVNVTQHHFLACAAATCSEPFGRWSVCLKPQMTSWRNDHWIMGSCSAVCPGRGMCCPQPQWLWPARSFVLSVKLNLSRQQACSSTKELCCESSKNSPCTGWDLDASDCSDLNMALPAPIVRDNNSKSNKLPQKRPNTIW